MKTLKYIILAIFIILVVFSCKSQTNSSNRFREIVLQSQGNVTTEQLSASKEVISNRLKTIYINNFTITQNSEKSQLVVKLSDTLNVQGFSDVLAAKGEVKFCLALSNQEVISQFKKLDQKLVLDNSKTVAELLSLMQSNNSIQSSSPTIGLIDSKDTALVAKCLNSKSLTTQLPGDIKFIWGKTANDQNKCTLFAIYNQDVISDKTIKEASVSTSKSFHIEINLSFNDEGSAKWKVMTGKNLGKAIAMVMDNKVYSAPTVRSEISNGKCTITGNYTGIEANNIMALIKNGSLPVDFKLIDK